MKYLDAYVKMAFRPDKSHLRKAGAILIKFLESCNTLVVRGAVGSSRRVPLNRVIEGRAAQAYNSRTPAAQESSLLRRS